MAARKAVSRAKPVVVRVRVNIKSQLGGEVVQANTDYATGGPMHPEVAAQIAKLKAKGADLSSLPMTDAAARDDDMRYIGDEVALPFGAAVGYLRTGHCDVPEDVALADPDATVAFHAKVNAGTARTTDLPSGMLVSGTVEPETPPATAASTATATADAAAASTATAGDNDE